MSAIEITHQDLSISQLRAEAARTAGAKQARRILAIAMVLDGHSRRLAAQAGGMERQTLRDWVHRYNADGLTGLADRPRYSASRCLTKSPIDTRPRRFSWRMTGRRPNHPLVIFSMAT